MIKVSEKKNKKNLKINFGSDYSISPNLTKTLKNINIGKV